PWPQETDAKQNTASAIRKPRPKSRPRISILRWLQDYSKVYLVRARVEADNGIGRSTVRSFVVWTRVLKREVEEGTWGLRARRHFARSNRNNCISARIAYWSRAEALLPVDR